jgi:hypothetical protein
MSKRTRDAASPQSSQASESVADATELHLKRRQERSEAIRREVKDRVNNGDVEGMLDDMCKRWELDAPHSLNASPNGFMALACRVFDLPLDEDIDLNARQEYGLRQLDETIEEHELEAVTLFNAIRLNDPNGERPDLQLRASKVIEMVYYAKRVVLSAFQARLAVHNLHCADLTLAEDLDKLLGSWTLRFRYFDQSKATAFQKLLLFLLDCAMEKRYRKQGDYVYEPITVGPHETHAWRQVCDIRKFVHVSTTKELNSEQWMNLTASPGNAKNAIDFLTNCCDFQFPFLRKDRSVFAFRNGVYVACDDEFYEFGGPKRLSDSVVAAKFFDLDFVPHDGDWRDIPTPNLDSIMSYQRWPPEVQGWMHIMLGRMLYDVGAKDGWQIIPFMHGAASSGKCFCKGTRVMAFDGSIRAVEDIRVGDLVMGDDSTPRRVLSLARGFDDMYTLLPRAYGCEPMTVTGEHILCLKTTTAAGQTKSVGKEVVQMTVNQYMALPAYLKRHLVCYRVPVNFAVTEEPLADPWLIGAWLGGGCSADGWDTAWAEAYGLLTTKHVPHALKTGSHSTRMQVLAGLLDTEGYFIDGHYEITLCSQRMAEDVLFLARSLGFGALAAPSDIPGQYHAAIFGEGLPDIPTRMHSRVAHSTAIHDARAWDFEVVPAGRQEYYGFQTTGNQRFLLGDFSVTHNSTIVLRVAALFYENVDVGVLSNNVERQFGISAFHDKFMFVGPEIKGDFRMEQAELQSIVSGEAVQVSIKHKTAMSVPRWKAVGMLAGNEVPDFSDNAGSIQRRFMVFSFLRAVVNGDMMLGDKLGTEIGAILLKSNRAYLEAAAKWGHKNVWTVVPEYFLDTRNDMACQVNSVEAFLRSEDDVVLGEEHYCPMKEFKEAWKSYARNNGYKLGKTNDTGMFTTVFDKMDLRIEKGTREYGGITKKGDWVVGADLVARMDGMNGFL